jgi:molybdopterin molybdotransferase
MQEYVKKDTQGNIYFTEADTKSNICYQGEDLKASDLAIKAGTTIMPQDIAIMASFGVINPLVACIPRVALICTGSELVEPSVKPNRAQIRNSNAYQLMGQLSSLCNDIDYLGVLPDSLDVLTISITKAMDAYDVILVTGGASVGDYDLMPAALKAIGAQVHFSALNIQPGKPVLYATIRNTHILGLSGNPVSSFLQTVLVVKPLLLRLLGSTSPPLKTVRVPLSKPIKRKKGNRQLYVPVSFHASGIAAPLPFHGSAHIAALSGFDGFAILDPEVDEIASGQLATILLP